MEALGRRCITIPSVMGAALALATLAPLWVPLAATADLLRGRRRLPTVRLLAFGLGWSWLESAGVVAAAALWCTGRARDQAAHYRLQRWWAAKLMLVLEHTTGMAVAEADVNALRDGPVILLCRHASLADSLVSAWAITTVADRRPRYVLKRELLADPCLDIVGHRVPNHFLDRDAPDSSVELAALDELAREMGEHDVVVIFPEGTRATPAKRERALAKIAERDPDRARRLAGLKHLLPPRVAGAAALVAAAPEADVAIGWHVGFDGLDTFGGILRRLESPPPPIRFVTHRLRRADVPSGTAFADWLDDQWLAADDAVHRLLHPADTGAAEGSHR